MKTRSYLLILILLLAASPMATAQAKPSSCDTRAESRQFDFWVGDWDVVATKENKPAGVSHIERAIGNCVIWENWTSLGTSGYTGKSYTPTTQT